MRINLAEGEIASASGSAWGVSNGAALTDGSLSSLLPLTDNNMAGMEMDGDSDAMTGADNTPQDSMEMMDNSRSERELRIKRTCAI